MAEEIDLRVTKDDRNKQRRFENRILKKKAGYVSSSPEPQSVIDVADSSDDNYYRRSKTSNWTRYEKDIGIDFTENEQMNAADFEFLQDHPTRGSHFIFNSEKEWENDAATTKTTNISYFNLNLSILNAGLQTIPFYKRMDYSGLNFSKNIIKEMDRSAEKAEIVYKELLKDGEEEILRKMQENDGKKSANSIKEKKKSSSTESTKIFLEPSATVTPKDGADDELDKLLNMTETDLSKINISNEALKSLPNVEGDVVDGKEKTEAITIPEKGNIPQVASGNQDIQQWLDNVLEM